MQTLGASRDLRLFKPTASDLGVLGGAWRQHPRYQGCVGHWLFTEGAGLTTTDLSGVGAPASLVSIDAATDWERGATGAVLDLNGSTQYVDCGQAANSPLDLGKANDSFTLLVRFIINTAPTATLMPLIKRASGSSAWAYVFSIFASGGTKLNFQQWGAAGNPSATSSTALSLGTAYSAALVRDHAAVLNRLYLNGVADGTGTNNPGDFSLATATELGRGNVAFTAFAAVKLIEARIQNRVLSPAEIFSWHHTPSLEFYATRAIGRPGIAAEDTFPAWAQVTQRAYGPLVVQ